MHLPQRNKYPSKTGLICHTNSENNTFVRKTLLKEPNYTKGRMTKHVFDPCKLENKRKKKKCAVKVSSFT